MRPGARKRPEEGSGTEITDHPPKPQTALQGTSEQDSAHEVDAVVGGSASAKGCAALHSVGQPAEQGAQNGTLADLAGLLWGISNYKRGNCCFGAATVVPGAWCLGSGSDSGDAFSTPEPPF